MGGWCNLPIFTYKRNALNKPNEQSAHEQTERTKILRVLLYSANSQMFVPFVIFHFPTLSCQLINTSLCNVPKENILTRSKFSNFTHLGRSAGVVLCRMQNATPTLRNFTPVVLKTTLYSKQSAIQSLQNFAPGVREVFLYDFLCVLAVLWPKIPIRYYPPQNE